jgi:hypothetical protein
LPFLGSFFTTGVDKNSISTVVILAYLYWKIIALVVTNTTKSGNIEIKRSKMNPMALKAQKSVGFCLHNG